MRKLSVLLLAAVILASCATTYPATHGKKTEKVMIAYVYNPREMPDPTYLTHINYAFGHVSDSFNSVRIENPDNLRGIVALKKQYPYLKVILSIGGWGSGNFSEMAADPELRMAFCKDCKRITEEFGLDGIDIDWEYPTSNSAGISCSPDDTENYTLLMRDLRSVLGPKKLLTHATVSEAEFIDYVAVNQYVDFTNVMTYDCGWPPYHNAPLYESSNGPGRLSVSASIEKYLALGVPADKLVMGVPFYGHAIEGFPRVKDMTKAHEIPGYTYHWDEVACVPYLTDNRTGQYAYGYENEESLRLKTEYALSKNLKGIMYWDYKGDTPDGTFRKLIYLILNPGRK